MASLDGRHVAVLGAGRPGQRDAAEGRATRQGHPDCFRDYGVERRLVKILDGGGPLSRLYGNPADLARQRGRDGCQKMAGWWQAASFA